MNPDPQASGRKVVMSSLKSAVPILDYETNAATVEAGTPARPVLVPKTSKRADNFFTRRVEAALDADFANGSMPA
jgi:hypothetical protein